MCGTGRSPLRVIRRPSSNPSATAVLLLHGWPDSVLRFERVLPLLQDLHVVVPALPGFPFALPLKEPASVAQIAVMAADAMAELGYDRYVVSGGDVGGTVAEIMAAEYPERVTALHLTNLSAARAAMADPASLPADALAYRVAGRRPSSTWRSSSNTSPAAILRPGNDRRTTRTTSVMPRR
jgi:pimeloyl-ACP methyl ester carboxylesterase